MEKFVASMTETYGDVWGVFVAVDGTNQPTVILKKGNASHIYNAATFIGLGGHSEYGFTITPLWDDEAYIHFSHEQWEPACTAVRAAIPGTAGVFDVRWIPNDPSLPF